SIAPTGLPGDRGARGVGVPPRSSPAAPSARRFGAPRAPYCVVRAQRRPRTRHTLRRSFFFAFVVLIDRFSFLVSFLVSFLNRNCGWSSKRRWAATTASWCA